MTQTAWCDTNRQADPGVDRPLLIELEAQHRSAIDILAMLEQAEGEDSQLALVNRLLSGVALHLQIEEQRIDPALAMVDPTLVDEANAERQIARDGIERLESLIGTSGFRAALTMLRAGIEVHVRSQEDTVFPLLRAGLPAL